MELHDLVGRDSVPDQAWERRLWQPADPQLGNWYTAALSHAAFTLFIWINLRYDVTKRATELRKLNKEIVFSKRKAV